MNSVSAKCCNCGNRDPNTLKQENINEEVVGLYWQYCEKCGHKEAIKKYKGIIFLIG